MTFSDLPQPTETPPAGPFGVPPEYFGPPDGETALRADEMHANRIETEAMGALRIALHHPETGFASRPPMERLVALPDIQETLDGIGETFRAQATTPRQRAILGPLLDNHLEHAATQVGRLAEQALAEADDGIVEKRIGNLQQDAAVNWDAPARLRILGRAVVTERRAQGERKGWEKDETEARVRQNVSDFYATAIEAGIDKDLDRVGKLLTDAQGVLLPDRQSMLARKLAEAREDRHVAGIAGTLAAIPLDPATPPNAEAYRARAEEMTPDDAAPELRARIAQLADTAQRHATKYWQHDRNQGGLAAIDWMVSNPGAPVVTMDRKVAAQLSPEQLARLQEIETTGRLDTDPKVYDRLDRLAVYDPKTFAATDLSQYRLALDGQDYARFTDFQKGGAAFARYDRGRTVLDAGLIKAQFDPDGPEARAARGELDKTLRSFEAIEGRPPTIVEIDQVAGEVTAKTTSDASSAKLSRNQPSNTFRSGDDERSSALDQLAQANPTEDEKYGGHDPSKFLLRFDGRYLRLLNGNEVIKEWPAVSGRESFGSGENQNKRNYGPIPEGTYDIKQSRYQTYQSTDSWDRLKGIVGRGTWGGGTRSWGTERVWADPTKETVEHGLTYGRTDMAIHGGDIPGSAGCIDLTGHMPDFAKIFRRLGLDLKLYVDYTPQP